MGVPFLGRLPLSLAIREASDAGSRRPLGRPEAEAFAAIAAKLLEARGALSRPKGVPPCR